MAIETTRRRLASTICCLATMSPRSMRLASATSCCGGQQRHAADRAQVQPQRVEARLDREVDLGLLAARSAPGLLARLGGGLDLAAPRDVAGLPSAPTTSMPCSSRCACSSWTCSFVTSTSSRRGGDLLEGQEAPLLTFGDELAELVELRDRRLVREQYVGSWCSTPILATSTSGGLPPGAAPPVLILCSPRRQSRRRRDGLSHVVPRCV